MLPMDHIEAPLLRDLKLPVIPTIVVVGAYKGDTVEFLHQHYPDAMIHAYEPQKWAYDKIVPAANIHKHNVALGQMNSSESLYFFETDGATLVPTDMAKATQEMSQRVRTVDALVALEPLGDIDLMVMNIEGYEYTLIPYIIGSIPVARLLVQYYHYIGAYSTAFENTRAYLTDIMHHKERAVGKGWFYYE